MMGKFGKVVDQEHIGRSRLRIDTRKWAASKLAPKKYGDKLDLNHAGGLNVKIGKEYRRFRDQVRAHARGAASRACR